MFFQNFSNEVIKTSVKLWELLDHNFIDDFCSFVFHNLMDSIIYTISWVLSFFNKGFNKAKKASIEGKPGIVESPGKLIIAF